ncbi:MAG: hypothetical protein Q7J12_05385, partial [Syntrophales bacterium]|nr:hypothetical protein [Syntrophales bacterium]
IVEHLTPFDAAYQMSSSKTAQLLQYKGIPASESADAGLSVIYHQLLKQASMLSFNDAFYLLGVLLVCTLPLVFFMKTAKGGLVHGDMH